MSGRVDDTSTSARGDRSGSDPGSIGERTPWSAGAALFFSFVAVGVAIAIAIMAQPVHAPVGGLLARVAGDPRPELATMFNTMLTLLVMQVVLIGLVWWGAARFGGDRLRVLSLEARLPLGTFLIGLGGMVALLAPYNLAFYMLRPDEFAADLRPFWALARSPAVWVAMLAVVIGAPIAEELLFRGFLLSALVKTRLGFAGAAVLSAAGWTALHFYSVVGMIEIFLIGVYFAWLMRRFGNLLLPLALHALYNGLQLTALALLPV